MTRVVGGLHRFSQGIRCARGLGPTQALDPGRNDRGHRLWRVLLAEIDDEDLAAEAAFDRLAVSQADGFVGHVVMTVEKAFVLLP